MIICGRFRHVLNMYLVSLTTHTSFVVSNPVGQYLDSAFVKQRFKNKMGSTFCFPNFIFYFSRGTQSRLFLINEMRLRQCTKTYLYRGELHMMIC